MKVIRKKKKDVMKKVNKDYNSKLEINIENYIMKKKTEKESMELIEI